MPRAVGVGEVGGEGWRGTFMARMSTGSRKKKNLNLWGRKFCGFEWEEVGRGLEVLACRVGDKF